MASWLDRVAPPGEGTGDPRGRCLSRSELIRFETSTERVFEARRQRTQDRGAASVSVVLLASHRDRNLLKPALNFLANQGVVVYVDYREGGAPDEPTAEFADWLRTCLARDDRLVLVGTRSGLTSASTPWLLGLADGALAPGKVAVLPVEDHGPFRASALVGLYPTIRRREGAWTVVGPGGASGPALEEWLTS